MTTRAEAFDHWLLQLRHPDSLKHRGELEDSKNPNARCCLGHLCHALGIESYVGQTRVYYQNNSTVLPEEVAELLDITTVGHMRKPVPYDDRVYYTLSKLNDESNIDTVGIADVIEKQLVEDNFFPFRNCLNQATDDEEKVS